MSKYIYTGSYVDAAGAVITSRNTTTPWITLVNGIPEGYSENQRVGREIQLKKLVLTIDANFPDTLTFPLNARILVFYVRHQNGAIPTMSTFFANLSRVPGSDANFFSQLKQFNVANSQRIECLFDQTISHYSNNHMIHKTIDLDGKKTYYSGATEFGDHVRDGSLYIVSDAYYSSTVQVRAACTLFYDD